MIGRRLSVPAASKAPDDAAGHFGFLAMFLGLDAPASSAFTREALGWIPTQRGLIADLEEGRYFNGSSSKFSGACTAALGLAIQR